MSTQVHCFRAQGAQTGSQYLSPINGQYFCSFEYNATAICTAAGTLSNFKVNLPVAPGTGKSWTITLRINGVASACSFTISDLATTGSYLPAVTLADGDELALLFAASGGPTASAPNISWEFTPTTAKQGIHAFANLNGTVGITRYGGFLFKGDVFNFGDTVLDSKEVVSAPGTITKWTVKTDTTIPAASTFTATIYRNGVAQDGTAGTPNTKIVFSAGEQKKSATFTMNVAAGDYFNVRCDVTGTASPKPIWGVRFVSTVDGEYNHSSQLMGNQTSIATDYWGVGNGSANNVTTTESDFAVTNGLTRCRLSNLYVLLNTALLSGGSYAFTLRKNSADSNLTTTITTGGGSGTDVANHDTAHNVAIGLNDVIGMKVAPSGSPSTRLVSWAMTISTQAGGKGAGGTKGPAFGGGAGQIIQPGGCVYMNIGNAGVDIGTTS